MNECHFIGRLTKDPELNEYGGVSKVTFSLALSERRKNKDTGEYSETVSFLDCFAWSSGADAIAKYFEKGSLIVVHCKAVQERWEKDGKKNSAIRFRVNNFEFPAFNSPKDKDKKNEGGGGGGGGSQQEQPTGGSGGGGGDDDIPF
jgi:single-strand DNA-binding protein